MKHINRLALGAAMLLAFGAAHADVVVVVSAKSSVGKLTKEQVADVFLGKSTSLPGASQAVPLDQAADCIETDDATSDVLIWSPRRAAAGRHRHSSEHRFS